MKTLAEVEALLPKLSREELARVEALLHRIRHDHELDARLDGRPWPRSSQEIAAELSEMDAIPPLLSPKEADRFDAWLAADRERQKAMAKSSGAEISKLFP